MDYQPVLDRIHAALQPVIGQGKVASYIPELANVAADQFGMAVVDVAGNVYAVGDAGKRFSIQSISKLFALTLAFQREGDSLWTRVGREPSGNPFNSLVQLERENGIPRNPFINAGALVITDMLASRSVNAAQSLVDFVRKLAGVADITYNTRVAQSEISTSSRNAAMAHFMKSFGNLHNKVGEVLQARGMKVGTGTIVDATIIAAPSSTKNADGQRDPEMHQTKKGNQWHFGMKLHIGVDSHWGVAHSAVVTAANVHDKHPLPDLLHGDELKVYGDSAYARQEELIASKAPAAKDCTNQRVRKVNGVADEIERARNRKKSKVRARVEHVFAVIKRQWGFSKVRYRGLHKNATRAFTMLALANIYMSRGLLLAKVRP